jgi:small-conductance mechanosensitive channel
MTYCLTSKLKTSILYLTVLIFTLLSTYSVAESAHQTPSTSQLLADMLENPETRQQLISELRSVTNVAEETEERLDQESLVTQIAEATQEFAQQLTSQVVFAAEAASDLGKLDWQVLAPQGLELLFVVLAAFISFFILRKLAIPVFNFADKRATQAPGAAKLLNRLFFVSFAFLVDIIIIALAWVIGYSIALFVVGELSEMRTTQSLFLNAFLVIEMFKAVVRLFFSSRHENLRLMPMCGETAAYWYTWLAKVTSFIGYGMLFVVPMISLNLAPALGHFTSLVIMVIAFAYAFTIIMQNKKRVASNIGKQAEENDFAFTSVLLNMLSRSWHLIAISYFAALVLVTAIRPEDALPVMLQASLQTLIAIVAGLLISAFLSQLISRQLRVSDDLKFRFPALEGRLNEFIPTTLKVIRLFIILVVFAFVLDAWSLFNFSAWITSEVGTQILGKVLSVGIILLIAKLLWIAFASWVEHQINPATGKGAASARQQTLLKLLSNAVMITLIVFTIMITLAEIGLNIGPLIAGAGVVGLAIGFGAQTLVKDVITGIFLQLENAINAGDVVTADGITGTAENLTIRSLGLRDRFGTYHLIPFSSITSVSNYMRGYGYHVGEYGVAYREDTDEVIVHLRAAFDELMSDEEIRDSILDDLEVQGVTELGDNAVNIRVRIKTLPGSQWSIGRAYNRLVKRHFDAAGVEIPFPHLTLYFGQNKDGSAPPAPLNLVSTPASRQAELGQSKQPDAARTNANTGNDFDEAD